MASATIGVPPTKGGNTNSKKRSVTVYVPPKPKKTAVKGAQSKGTKKSTKKV